MEMEWEFSDSGESVGQFMATGKVFTILRGHLARGEIDQAVELYESCVQNVGEQLWNEFQGASKEMKKAIANLFYRSRDYARSAAACEKLGEWVAAGRSYEAAYDLPRAAACYLKAGSKEKAAAVHEKSGDYRRAAELYYEAGNVDASAAALERSGDLVGAAQLYVAKNDSRKAAQLLAQVQPGEPHFIHAVALLTQVLMKLGRRDLAIQRLVAAMPRGRPVQDPIEAELAYRLGRLWLESNRPEDARQAFELVRAWNPGFKDVAGCLAALDKTSSVALPMSPSPSPSASASASAAALASSMDKTGPMAVPVFPAQSPTRNVPPAAVTAEIRPPAQATDPFAALDGNPFSRRRESSGIQGPPPPAQTVPIGFVTRMEGYEFLKKMSIFADLSLDEMKAFFGICDQVFYQAGDLIIEQGRPGESLVIVREGSIRVSKIEEDREVTLATLPAGNCVGEMSLVDDVPTSARVTAATAVKALRIRRDRFEQFMFANDRVALRVYRSFVRQLSGRLRETNAQMGR